MFLSSLTSSDPRFKTLHFREGLNILVADRTETSEQGDSRNSIGKTSFVKVLKYVLGGDLASEFKVPELAEHSFTATLSLPSADDEVVDEVTVTRAVSPATRVRVLGWSATGGATDLHVDEWRELLSRSVFRIPEDASRPTAGQIWGQLIRTYFGNPIKGHQSEADWESGVKLGFMLTATLSLPSADDEVVDEVTVTRAVSPATRVRVLGWSATGGATDLHVDEWRELLSRSVFRIPEDASRPTAGQIWGQLIRTYFGNPIKGHQSEADWESGVKLGFMLGLSPEILGKAGDVDRLTKQGKAIRAAVKEGAIAHLSLDESALRAQLATARRQRDRTQNDLRSFKVDEQYADHQRDADSLSGSIQRINDEALSLQRRLRELEEALQDEIASIQNNDLAARLERVYAEIGLVLPDTVSRRYSEVQAFHESVVRNRRSFLEQEFGAVRKRLEAIDAERRSLDEQRSQVMRLLNETVALDTFLSLQRDLAKQESDVADLERRLEAANSISTIGDTIKLRTAELVASVRTELNERGDSLGDSIALFGELGAEIYTDREASLLVTPTVKGLLGVTPRISGDASTGVRSVETR